jgi:hypothetical protein
VNWEKSCSGADFYVKGETSASEAGGDAFVVNGEMSRSRAMIDEGTCGEMRHRSRNEIYVGGGKSEHVLNVVNGETSGSGADPDANGEICGSWIVVDVKTTNRMKNRSIEDEMHVEGGKSESGIVIVNGETSGSGRHVAGVLNRWQRYGEMSDSATCTA